MVSSSFAKARCVIPVMVRDHDLRPVRLFAGRATDAYVEIGQRDSEPLIGFPRGLVFQYEDLLYQSLEDAYESGQMDQLFSLWRNAKQVGIM